jgi:hypothetical protein
LPEEIHRKSTFFLSLLMIGDEQICRRGNETDFFSLAPIDDAYFQKDNRGVASFSLLDLLGGHIISFGSLRDLGSEDGNIQNLYALANGNRTSGMDSKRDAPGPERPPLKEAKCTT